MRHFVGLLGLESMAFYRRNEGDLSGCLVVSVGEQCPHWSAFLREFPRAMNCCISVWRALSPESGEELVGNGFDKSFRDRMKAKDGWGLVWNVCHCVLREFGVLVVLCKHGKDRSLSLAIELADYFGCEFRAMRDEWRPRSIRPVDVFLNELRPRFKKHVLRHGGDRFPVMGVGRCVVDFDGPEWVGANDPSWCHPDYTYLDMRRGSFVLQLHRDSTEAQGWSYGSEVLLPNSESGWFPPTAVSSQLGKDSWVHLVLRSLSAIPVSRW